MKRFYDSDAKAGSGNWPEDKGPVKSSAASVSAASAPEDAHNSAGISPLDEAIVRERFSTDAQKKVRDFRTRIDSLYLTAKKLPPSREISLAITSFQQARQFTGIMLKEIGAQNPYPQSTNKDSEKIEERADKGEILSEVLVLDGEIAKVKHLRSITGDLITDFTVYLDTVSPGTVISFIAQNKVVECVLGGKMWLGERLGMIKEGDV